MRAIYKTWKQSKTLYEIFLVIAKSNEEQTLTSLASKLKKDRKLVSEQVQNLVLHKILSSTKKGKFAIITVNETWKNKHFPKVKTISDIYTFLTEFRNLEQLYEELDKQGNFKIVAAGISVNTA